MRRAIIVGGIVVMTCMLLFVSTLTPDNIQETPEPVSATSEAVVIPELRDPLAAEPQMLADEIPDRTFNCSNEAVGEPPDMQALAQVLRGSDDPEHLLMATLYGGEKRFAANELFPEKQDLDALFAGLTIDPRNELLLWNAVTLCAKADDQGRCDDEKIPERAAEVLGENSLYWLRLAGIQARSGDEAETLVALEKALSAPAFEEYFVQHIEMFARGIAAYDNSPYNERVMTAFTLSTALWKPEIDVFSACKKSAETSVRWLDLCLQVGQRMEAQGKTLMMGILGTGLQREMYEYLGDERSARLVGGRHDGLVNVVQNVGRSANASTVLINEDYVLAAYIDHWKSGGERQAQQYLHYEARRLMRDPDYSPCD